MTNDNTVALDFTALVEAARLRDQEHQERNDAFARQLREDAVKLREKLAAQRGEG